MFNNDRPSRFGGLAWRDDAKPPGHGNAVRPETGQRLPSQLMGHTGRQRFNAVLHSIRAREFVIHITIMITLSTRTFFSAG
jgi:hypothetical protein